MRAIVLIAALLLDRFVGEYPNRWHPVVWMGTSIRALERRAPLAGRALPFAWGLGMATGVPMAWAALGLGVEALAWPLVEGVLAALLRSAGLRPQPIGSPLRVEPSGLRATSCWWGRRIRPHVGALHLPHLGGFAAGRPWRAGANFRAPQHEVRIQ